MSPSLQQWPLPLVSQHGGDGDSPPHSGSLASSPPCCEWPGLACNPSGRVVSIVLSRENIEGTIVSSSLAQRTLAAGELRNPFGALPFLHTLNLQFNPGVEGKLRNIVEDDDELVRRINLLDLSSTGVSGLIPAAMRKLYYAQVTLRSTKVESDVPPSVVREAVNSTLDLSSSPGIWGPCLPAWPLNGLVLDVSSTPCAGVLPLPTPITGTDFVTVRLSSTRLSGTMSPIPGKQLLRGFSLDLRSTRMSGTLPTLPAGVESVELLLSSTSVSGSIPLAPGPSLRTLTLDAAFTTLEGLLPESLCSLEEFNINLRSTLIRDHLLVCPTGIDNLRRATLDVSATNVVGTLCPIFLSTPNLRLYIRATAVSGTLPNTMGGVVELDAAASRLSGTIPPALLPSPKLEKIILSASGFTGKFDVNMLRSPNLRFVHISANLTGDLSGLPLLRSSNLTSLLLQDNCLSGEIPDELCALPQLRLLNVRGNRFTKLPDCLGSSPLVRIDASNNLITGLNPLWLGSNNLQHLDLSRNHIPVSPALCYDVAGLTLEQQQERARSNLAVLDISHNYFVRGFRPTMIELLRCLGGWPSLNSLDASGFNVMPGVVEKVNDVAVWSASLRTVTLRSCDLQGSLPSLSVVNLPSLESADLSDNPGLRGRIPDAFGLLSGALDVRNTNFDVCRSPSIFALGSLQSIDIRELVVPWVPACIDTMLTYVEPDFGVLSPSQQRSRLACPSWTSKSQSRAVVHVDQSFLGYYGCVCPAETYFGLDRHTGLVELSWSEYRASAADSFECMPCPDLIECDNSAAENQAQRHKIVGGYFPIYHVEHVSAKGKNLVPRWDGAWGTSTKRWRLPYAVLVKCAHPAICNVKSDDGDDVGCREGHENDAFACSRCMEDYFMSGSLCEPCPDSYKWVVPLVLTVFILAMLAFLRFYKFTQPGRAVEIGLFWFNLLATLERIAQRLSVGDTHRSSGSSNQGFFASGQSAFESLSAFEPFALECVDHRFDWRTTTSGTMALPLVIIFGSLLMFLVDGIVSRAWREKHAWRSLWLRWARRPRLMTAIFFMLNVLVFPVAVSAFQVLHCMEDSRSGIEYVAVAPYVTCSSDTYDDMRALATAAIVLYLLPFPPLVTLMIWLEKRRQARRVANGDDDDDDEEAEMQSIHYVSLPSGDSNASAAGWPTRSHRSSLSRIATHSSSNVTFLSFLIVSTHKWYWPLVLSVRSVILAAVTGLFSYDSVFLPLCVFLLLIGSLLLHVLNKPFVLQVDNWLETLVFAASIMMYLAQMLIGLGLNQSGLSAFTSVVSLLVLLALFAGLAATIIMHRRAKAKM